MTRRSMKWINRWYSGSKLILAVLLGISTTVIVFKVAKWEDSLPEVSPELPLIVYWTPFFHLKIGEFFGDSKNNCAYKCAYLERNQWQDTKYSSIIPSAYILHNRDVKIDDLPDRKPHQLIVFMLQESPINAGEQIYQIPKDYYNATMTYREDSDYFIPYGGLQRIGGINPILWDQNEVSEAIKRKTHGALAFISNCNTTSKREDYIRELMNYTLGTVYGCNEVSTIQEECPVDSQCEKDLVASHRFYLSFENSVCKDYITEKFFNRLNQLLVPVVLRRSIANISSIPSGSFIAADDFGSPRELGKYLNQLIYDDKEYRKYFEWTKHYQKGLYPGDSLCKLCADIHEKTKKTVPDIVKYYMTDGKCEGRTVFQAAKLYLNRQIQSTKPRSIISKLQRLANFIL